MAEPWEPATTQVAVYVPWLTVSVNAPGDQTYLNDFTDDTSPNATVAGRHITDAATVVASMVTTLPVPLYPLAATATARYAAATLAAAYARTEDDAARATALLAEANLAIKQLQDAADNAGASALSPVPVGFYPDPVPWGDQLVVGVRTPIYPPAYPWYE